MSINAIPLGKIGATLRRQRTMRSAVPSSAFWATPGAYKWTVCGLQIALINLALKYHA